SRRAAPPTDRQLAVVRECKNAWQTNDMAALVALLDPDVTFAADGGGLAPAALETIEGAEQIARYLVALGIRAAGMTILELTVNVQPGLIAHDGRTIVTVFAF